MPQEIELKLSLPPDAASRLGRNPLVRSLTQRRSKAQQLVSVYFDTPDHKLAANGMGLRVRRLGAKRIQTLKAAVDATTGLQVHQEIETEIAADMPDLTLVEDEPLKQFLEVNRIGPELQPVFVTEFERRSWLLTMFDSEIELALDIGEIRSDGRRMELREAELELRSGKPERLYELALALHATVPFTLEARTKSARGYALRSGARPEPQRALPVRLDAAASAAQAFAAIARTCMVQLRANEEAARLGEDPEGIHQMRVAVRRLRALLGIYRDATDGKAHAYLSAELRWLQQQLGPARDWDVFIEDTLEPLHRRLGTELAVEALRREAKQLRDAAYEVAVSAMAAPRYTEFLLKLGLLIDGGGWIPQEAPPSAGVDAFARAMLQRRHKRLRKYGGRHADLTESELHRLRLLGKKMRYAVEFFRDLYPRKAVKRYHTALVEIQETLGSLNDAAVSRQLVVELERRMASSAPALTPRAVGLVLGWQAARIDGDLRRFGEVWARFADAKPFWPR